MRRKQAAALQVSVVCLLLAAGRAGAEIGTIDDVPAATLLLPYFECELDANLVPATGGVTTLFSINNASATAVLAHVTLWTDESIPTLDFDVYLTGYDVQTINVCDIFNGNLPVTASAGQDPKDTHQPQGPLSQDINFAVLHRPPAVRQPGGRRDAAQPHPQRAHRRSLDRLRRPLLGLRLRRHDRPRLHHGGHDDPVLARLPVEPGYFTGVADFQNVLWGDYFYVDNAENFANGETLVHIEACKPGNGYIGYVGTGRSGVNPARSSPVTTPSTAATSAAWAPTSASRWRRRSRPATSTAATSRAARTWWSGATRRPLRTGPPTARSPAATTSPGSR